MTEHLVVLRDGWTAWRWIALRSAGFAAADVLSFAAPAASRAIDRFIELEDARDPAAIAARADAVAALGRERLSISAAVHARARDPRFREALTWQNRTVIDTLLAPLLASRVGSHDAPTRRREATVATYAQRYCVKNDTIGFFGPVGWAELTDGSQMLRQAAGQTLLDRRRVHFEYWCIDAIAARIADDPQLRLALAPRRLPSVRIEGDVVHYPIARTARVGPEILAVLAACDGETPAHAIAARLADQGLSDDDVYGVLGELVDARLIRWTLEIPTAGQFPEQHVHAQLAALPAGEARDRAMQTMTEIEAARGAVARAAGDPIQLGAALDQFSETFTNLTGVAATRRAGETYAGRTLLYEETRRAVEIQFGAPFRERLAAPLALILQSARWYTHAVAEAYHAIALSILRAAAQPVDYLTFVEQFLPQLATQQETAPVVREIVATLQARWAEVLAIPAGVRRVDRASAALAPKIAAAFAAPQPGWPLARYQSPDLMVAAASPAAFARGEVTCVLGEIHTGLQTLTPVFSNLHADPEAMVRARRADLGRPSISTVEPRAMALRTDFVTLAPDDLDIEVGDAKSWRAREHVLPAAELVVEERDGKVCVSTRDGHRSFAFAEVFESPLILASGTHFHFVAPRPRSPRISIDGLVVAREAWTFAPNEIAFAAANGFDRFAGARAWARRHELPRFVFVRIPEESKPCFVDLESPVYIEAFARLVRKASIVMLSEMLPAIDETWLVDAEQRTYTAELRMTAVDPVPWRP